MKRKRKDRIIDLLQEEIRLLKQIEKNTSRETDVIQVRAALRKSIEEFHEALPGMHELIELLPALGRNLNSGSDHALVTKDEMVKAVRRSQVEFEKELQSILQQ